MIYTKFDTREGMEDALLDIGAARVRRTSAAGDAVMVPQGTIPYYILQCEEDGKWLCLFGGQPSEQALERLEDHLTTPY